MSVLLHVHVHALTVYGYCVICMSIERRLEIYERSLSAPFELFFHLLHVSGVGLASSLRLLRVALQQRLAGLVQQLRVVT